MNDSSGSSDSSDSGETENSRPCPKITKIQTVKSAERYVYTDFMSSTEQNKIISSSSSTTAGGYSNAESSSPNSVTNDRFPFKLHDILSRKDLSHIIAWLPHGRSFKIYNKALLETTVLPLFFDSANYNSFVRLLNAWQFRRIKRRPQKNSVDPKVAEEEEGDFNSYYHELFLRGRPSLFRKMRRLQRSNDRKAPMKREDEPVFTKLPALPEFELAQDNSNTPWSSMNTKTMKFSSRPLQQNSNPDTQIDGTSAYDQKPSSESALKSPSDEKLNGGTELRRDENIHNYSVPFNIYQLPLYGLTGGIMHGTINGLQVGNIHGTINGPSGSTMNNIAGGTLQGTIMPTFHSTVHAPTSLDAFSIGIQQLRTAAAAAQMARIIPTVDLTSHNDTIMGHNILAHLGVHPPAQSAAYTTAAFIIALSYWLSEMEKERQAQVTQQAENQDSLAGKKTSPSNNENS